MSAGLTQSSTYREKKEAIHGTIHVQQYHFPLTAASIPPPIHRRRVAVLIGIAMISHIRGQGHSLKLDMKGRFIQPSYSLYSGVCTQSYKLSLTGTAPNLGKIP
jgi:hypothetical protein